MAANSSDFDQLPITIPLPQAPAATGIVSMRREPQGARLQAAMAFWMTGFRQFQGRSSSRR